MQENRPENQPDNHEAADSLEDVMDVLESGDEAERAERAAQSTLIRDVSTHLKEGEVEAARAIVADMHAADAADLFEQIDTPERRALALALREEFDPDILSELEGQAFEDVIGVLEPHEIADAVAQLDTDDAVFVLEEMPAEDQQQVLEKIEPDDRLAIEQGLSYPEDSAGRLMQRNLIAVPPFWTVGHTIDYLREQDNIPEEFYEIFVVDEAYNPIGTVQLSRLMRTKRPVKLQDIMVVEQTLIPVEMDQEAVAYRFRQYNLVSAAVVDASGRLVGVITVDDIVDVIQEEAEEDILALGGVSQSDVTGTVSSITKARFGWLVVNLGTAILASIVIGLFDASIDQMVALAILMPIVASMGGNAGTQTMTVAVRALAVRELTAANAVKIVMKELQVSLINGVLLALLTGLVTMLWFQSLPLGSVIAAAMVINLISAGLSGILVPMALDRAGVDPAVASTVFVTTITDVVGFFAFLGLAALFLL